MKRPIFFMAGCGLIILAGLLSAAAQTPTPLPTPAPPSSEIFIIDLKTSGKLKVGQPRKITSDAGYNNQPSFLPDGQSILYTSIKNKQADIYRYDLRGG